MPPKKKEPKSTKEPPIEGTAAEYQELLQIAASLDAQDARSELIESARYGELDCVKALLQIWTSKINEFIDTTDSNGATALHKAAASGHDSTVQLLLFHNAKHLINSSGKNTPLHWAAANGHENVVEMILDHDFTDYQEDAIDVLVKNGGGRSALTEGFSSQKTKLVGLLLEHDSAAEERLLMGAKEVDDDGNEVDSGDENGENGGKGSDKNNDAKHGITHEFDLLRDGNEAQPDEGSEETFGEAPSNILSSNGEEGPKTLLIRELPIKDADNPFDEGDEKLDTTGLGIWSASIVMARWMASKASLGRFDDKNVLELGAGCAVPGLALGMYSDAKVVYITDYNPATIDNLKYNIDINANRPCTKSRAGEWLERIKPLSIDWADEATWPKEKMDFVIGSDLIYQKSIVPLLKKVVNGLIKDHGSFLYTCPSDGRDGLVEFIETMKKEGFRCVSEEVAPDLYRSNPLSNGDAEDAFLHFYELPVTVYKLFEFKKQI
jgi:predicted nicotinamide N-methyase